MTGERIRAMRWWDIPQVHDIEVQCFPDDSVSYTHLRAHET